MNPEERPLRLSAMVICQDEEGQIARCLASLEFCDEIVVIDGGSTDRTRAIAEEHGARVIERAFDNYGTQKEFGRQQCRGTWILNVDADEVVSEALAGELSRIAQSNEVEFDGLRIPFENHFRDHWVRGAGWSPDLHLRFARRENCHWEGAIHESLVGRTEPLRVTNARHAITHYTYRSFSHALAKTERYARLRAEEMHRAGRRAGPLDLLIRPGFRFFRAFVLQAGFRDGAVGLLISGLQAYEVFQKYARLWEMRVHG